MAHYKVTSWKLNFQELSKNKIDFRIRAVSYSIVKTRFPITSKPVKESVALI